MSTVQSISFQGKQRFLPTSLYKDVQELKNKMFEASSFKKSKNGLAFENHYLTTLKMKDKSAVFDGDILSNFKSVSLKIGHSRLDINSENGEILKVQKPFFKTLKGVINDTQAGITKFLENFDNQNEVEKFWFGIRGFTQKGVKKLFQKNK